MIINNFNIAVFKRILKESLLVNEQIMMEVNSELIKSVSFSNTKSLIKINTTMIDDLIKKHNYDEEVVSKLPITEENNIENFTEKFNLYILKGNLFLKYLDIFSVKDSAKLIIDTKQTPEGLQASCLIIEGVSESGSKIRTKYLLSVDELITDRVSDYDYILEQCTPKPNYLNFSISEKQTSEIKNLIKKLHKSIPNNTNFITFTFDNEGNLKVNDNVFSIEIIYDTNKNKSDFKGLTFNVLKTDFLKLGDYSFAIHTDNESSKVIFGTTFMNSIIWSMTLKVGEDLNSTEDISTNIDDLDLDLSEYEF